MQIDLDIINHIIAEHICGNINAEEQVLLNKWRENEDNNRYFENITDPANLLLKLRVYHKCSKVMKTDRQTFWQKYEKLANEPVIQKPRKIWLKVAASLLLLMLLGIYFLVNRKPAEQRVTNNTPNQQPKENDVLPGKHKATLQLADGRNIVLDSIGNVQIAQQGGTTIINNTDGQIVYNVTDKVNTADSMLYNTLKTEKGQTYSVVLPDGSKVWLNAASTINYPVTFNDKERRVKITGEAYFEIKSLLRDLTEKIPFIVIVQDSAGNTCEEVEVLGTQFNINAYKEENRIITTLLEGKVKIKKEKNIILSEPNQQGVLSKATGDLTIVRNDNVEKIIAWKNNYFYFEKDSLATVIKQIARWYDVNFVIDTRLSNKTFSGRIQRDMPLSKILEKVEMTSGVKFDIYEGKRSFTISPKP
jgi:transmembrane sensor